ERIHYANRYRLSNISTDEGFADAVRLAVDAGLNNNEINEMAAKVNDSRSAVKQRAYIKHLRDEVYADLIAARKVGDPAGIKSVRTRSPKQMWSMSLGLARTLPPMSEVIKGLSDPERTAMLTRIREVLAVLQGAEAALGGHR